MIGMAKVQVEQIFRAADEASHDLEAQAAFVTRIVALRGVFLLAENGHDRAVDIEPDFLGTFPTGAQIKELTVDLAEFFKMIERHRAKEIAKHFFGRKTINAFDVLIAGIEAQAFGMLEARTPQSVGVNQ